MGCCPSSQSAPKPSCQGQQNAVTPSPPQPPPNDLRHPSIKPVDKTLKMQDSILGKPDSDDITEHYTIGKRLGHGQFGAVRHVTHLASRREYACKSIYKAHLKGIPQGVVDVKKELQIMMHLAGNPNIVQVVETFEDPNYVHLIMELCTGGDMVNAITHRCRYTEKDAAAAIRTILSVVAYCHDMGVIHRDLKLDNFLLDSDSSNAVVKVTDFGLSTFYKPGDKFFDLLGTAYYIAPEILAKTGYDEKVDVWACGAILYILLDGSPPFQGVRDEDVYLEIQARDPIYREERWKDISPAAQEAVRLMMTRDPAARPSAAKMLQHEWVRKDGVAADVPLEPEVLARMKAFASMNKLKREALMVIAHHLPPDDIVGLLKLFGGMDTDNSGTITVTELRAGLESKGSDIPMEELAPIIAQVDVDRSGELDYVEFIASTLHLCKLEREETLLQAFKHFDTDNSGYITRDELHAALSARGAAVLEADIEDVLSDADQDGDGRIAYTEFVTMMKSGKASDNRLRHLAGRYMGQQLP